LELTTRSWFLSDSCGLVDLGRLLWREDGSVFCICCWPFPAQSFSGPSPLGLTTIFYCLKYQVNVKVMLRPTISRPVCLGTKHPFGAYDQILIFVWQLRVCWFGASSLTRGGVCRLQLLLVLASAVIFGSESRRTRGHILLSRLKFESYCPVHVGRPLSHERSGLSFVSHSR
jgi:hypothetical protein